MTVIDDVDLSQRLRALRAAPPENGFEERLAARLRAPVRELKQAPPTLPGRLEPGRLIVGPWLRRHPVRLVGTAALLLAGAAAAMEGGVVEWVQNRVAALAADAPVASPPAPDGSTSARRQEHRRAEPPERELARAPAAPTASEPEEATEPPAASGSPASSMTPAPAAPNTSDAPLSDALANAKRSAGATRGERLARERRDTRALDAAGAAGRHSNEELPAIPRLLIEPRPLERADHAERVELTQRPGAGAGREPGRDLERIREVARARRERANAERPRILERLRERHERSESEGERNEGRGSSSERGRRERSDR